MKVMMLAVLGLVLLVSGMSEGRIFTRCDLKSTLVNVTTNATMPANTTVDLTLIAQIVCSAERLSRLNTNLVTPLRGVSRPPGRPGRRPRDASSSDSSEENSRERLPIIARLFGIFQLSDRVACASGSVPSLNFCGTDCSTLIDDNISNDITCLMTLLKSTSNAFSRIILLPIRRFPLRECLNVSPARFFARCPMN